jgi:hypothetical protein
VGELAQASSYASPSAFTQVELPLSLMIENLQEKYQGFSQGDV